MRNLATVFLVFLSLTSAFADEVKNVESVRTEPLIELGISLGTPAGLNAHAGVWGTSKVPLVFRVSGMYYGEALKGAQGDLGIILTPNSSFKQYVAVSGTTVSGRDFDWKGVGPSYGFNWNGFATQVGLSFGSNSDTSLQRFKSPQLQFQIGYSVLF